jgi:2,3,4,5-tetrahydropyridine-2,6-dicarboxylate N-succinyltransferase
MLASKIESLFDNKPERYTEEHQRLFAEFKAALNGGGARAAEPDAASPTGWRVNGWVKKGILLGFRMGDTIDMSMDRARFPWFDKATWGPRQMSLADNVRIVPGGSSIRDGCYVAKGVICAPPMFINVGAYVGEGTMVDSHALVGSCAQVGKNCHISAAAQIGGVLEPVGAMPVILEDDVLMGGNTGVYEGTVVKRRAILGTGVVLNRSTPIYDITNGQVHRAGMDANGADQPLVVPEGAVVIAGSRPINKGQGKEWGLSLYTPVIIKYRDDKTDAKAQIEDLLR